MKLHFPARRRIRPTPDIPAHHLIVFGQHVLDGEMKIRHRFVHSEHHLFVPFHTSWFASRAIVVIEIGSHVFVYHGGVTLVDEVFEMALYKLLHLG